MKNLSGRVFKRWHVLRRDGRHYFLCRCECGTKSRVSGYMLLLGRSGQCQRCGQGHGGVRSHGATGTPTYNSWSMMKQRCLNPRATGYHNYGGRGIEICKRWLGKKGFENFLADMGERPAGLSLDRRNNNRNYYPENTRWANRRTQRLNSRVGFAELHIRRYRHIVRVLRAIRPDLQ